MTKTLGKLPVESVSVGLALVHLRRFVVRRMIGQKRTGPTLLSAQEVPNRAFG